MARADELPPLPGDDDLRAALADAELVALLAACAHVTGDLSILSDDLRPDPLRLREPQAGYGPEQQEAARRLALTSLRSLRDDLAGVPVTLQPEQMQRIANWMAGEEISDRYLPLLREELAVDGDLRAPQWHVSEVAGAVAVEVLIIGAGMSGIAAGHRLRQAGVPFRIIEKNSDVGGTWLENGYPGCRVDIQNHMYSYSFAQKHDWPFYNSPRSVLLDYFRDCADRFGVRDSITFGTEVTSCTWNDERHHWSVELRSADGTLSRTTAEVVVSAVGQLNRPLFPDIDGRDSFTGPSFHSAQWDDTVDLRGKRVAVIGTGASACQLIPIVAEDAAHLTVFQRTAPWMIPAERYRQPVAAGFQLLLGHVPFYSEWYRFWLFWRGAEGMLPAATVDPDYPPTERSVSAANDTFRQLLLMWLAALTAGDDELARQLTPDYPPLSKRFVVDDGAYVAALRRDNVELICDPIEAINKDGLSAGGQQHDVDVIIYSTGFQASRFLTPMQVSGRDGVDLHEQWAGDARAYLGMLIPNFPNFFCLYGPNTNIVVNGSIIYFSECEVHYLLEAVRLLVRGDVDSIEPRLEVHDAYNATIDAANRLRTWGFSGVNSWYKNEFGRSAQNWPFSVLEFWEQTRRVDLSDLRTIQAPLSEGAVA